MVAATLAWAAGLEALRDWVRLATDFAEGNVIWAYPDNPSPMRPFAWVSITSGPNSTARPENRRSAHTMSEQVTVAAAQPGYYTIRVYNADQSRDAFDDVPTAEATYPADETDDPESIRDALGTLLAIEDSGLVLTAIDEEGEDAEAPTVRSLRIDGAGGIRHFHVELESPEDTMTQATLVDALRETSYVPSELTVRVQIETDSQRPTEHARYHLSKCEPLLGFRYGPVATGLRDAGFAFRRAFGITDLSGLMGAQNVSRASQDFIFAVAAQISQTVPWIRRATHTGAFS